MSSDKSYSSYSQFNVMFQLNLSFVLPFERLYSWTVWSLCLLFFHMRLIAELYLVVDLWSAHSGDGRADDSASKAGLLRRIWNSWIPIPTGVGLTLLAVLQWRRIQNRDAKQQIKVAKDWEVECYRALPLRSVSRMFGWVSSCYLPEKMRPSLYSSYSRLFGVNTAEISQPLESYPCLSDFFCRQLKDGCRPIDKHDIVSPADGRVLSIGKVCSCRLEQVKGVTYNIKSFLGPSLPVSSGQYISTPISKSRSNSGSNSNIENDWSQYRSQLIQNKGNELYQVVVYLGPGDYHRFHSPADVDVFHRRHFQGDLLSVSPRIAAWVPGLFSLNERAVYFGTWRYGYFSFTAVGATNVGSIRVYQDKNLHTNQRKWKDGSRERETPLNFKWKKGEEIGEFRMGSTVVLIFEAPPCIELGLQPGDRIQVGQSLIKNVISDTSDQMARGNA